MSSPAENGLLATSRRTVWSSLDNLQRRVGAPTASGKVLDAVQHALDGFYIEAIMTRAGPFAITIHLSTLQGRDHADHIRRPWTPLPHTFKPFCLGCLR